MADGTNVVEPLTSTTTQITAVDSKEIDYGGGTDLRDRQRLMISSGKAPYIGAGTDATVMASAPSDTEAGLVVRTAGMVKASLADENGVPYNATTKRLPVDIAGANITGTFTSVPSVVSVTNTPTGLLAAGAQFVGAWEDVLAYASIQVAIFTDAASAASGAVIDFSANGTDILRSVATSIPANFPAYFHLAPEARYVRLRYTNGATAQTISRVSVIYSYVTPSEVVQPLGSTITDANVGTVVRAALAGRIMSGASTGAYAPLGTDGTGNLLVKGADVRTLTERMFAKAPQTGYSLWIDTADLTYIYIAEAVSTEVAGTAATFQGIRVTKDATGNPLGKVQIATAFAWATRSAATWV